MLLSILGSVVVEVLAVVIVWAVVVRDYRPFFLSYATVIGTAVWGVYLGLTAFYSGVGVFLGIMAFLWVMVTGLTMLGGMVMFWDFYENRWEDVKLQRVLNKR